MIINALITVVLTILTFVVNLFPNADQEVIDFINSKLSVFKGAFVSANFFIDVTSLFTVLGFVIAIEALMFGIEITKWILRNLSIGFLKK